MTRPCLRSERCQPADRPCPRRWRDRWLHADAYVTFALEPDGSIGRMKMLPVSDLTDFSFDFQDLLFTPVVKEEKN